MRRIIGSVALACLIASACGESPTAATEPGVPTPSFDVAGNSGCAPVQFKFAGPVTYPVHLPITGDLEGMMTLNFSDDVKLAGVTAKNGGTADWDVTGGVLGALSFVTEFDNKNFLIDRPGSPDFLFENMGQHRALEGVQKANLHYKGTFDFAVGMVDWDFRGVICP